MGVSSSNGFTVSDAFTNHATCKIVIFAIVIDSSKLLIIVAKSSILNGFEVPPLQCIIFVLYPSKLKKKVFERFPTNSPKLWLLFSTWTNIAFALLIPIAEGVHLTFPSHMKLSNRFKQLDGI